MRMPGRQKKQETLNIKRIEGQVV